MKHYKRARQKRLDLTSIHDYTIINRNEERIFSRKQGTDETLLASRKDNGQRWDQPGGSGTEDRRGEAQHQQSDAGEECCEHRFSTENCGEPRSGRGTEGPKKVGDAA